MSSAALRQKAPSFTNESGVLRTRRAQESAFQRWSIPCADEVAFSEPVSAVPPSFQVYTPDQTRTAPLRGGHRPSLIDAGELVVEPSEGAATRMLLMWTGAGVAAGICVLTILLVIFNLSDETRPSVATSSARANLGLLADNAASTIAAGPAAPTAAPPIVIPVVVTPPDMELDGTLAAPAKKAGVKAKKPTPTAQPRY